MNTYKWALGSLLLTALMISAAAAQTSAPLPLDDVSAQQSAYQVSDSSYAVADNQPNTVASPSNQPPAPEAAKPEEEKKEEEKPAEEEQYKLFKCPQLECRRIDVRGWLDAGFTWNPDNPTNRFNGPVAYNDRSNEGELNQLYFITERVTKVENDCGTDIGGRFDLLYGTDRRFPQTIPGTAWDSRWNADRFYGLAAPQAYVDLAVNKWVFRAGHFLAPCGYESVMAPENFFYSHSYEFLYGQPTTMTGGMATYKINDKLSANFGLTTGWNEFESLNDKITWLGGFNWTSKDEKTTLAIEGFIGDTSPGGVDSTRTHACVVLTQKIGEKYRYALEMNFGNDPNVFTATVPNAQSNATWYGFSNYLFYDINNCWSAGGRYEYFSDLDGFVVAPVSGVAVTPAIYNTVAFGLNYKPNKNLAVRSEVRGDWSASQADLKPFEDGTKSQQFLWGTDVIVRF